MFGKKNIGNSCFFGMRFMDVECQSVARFTKNLFYSSKSHPPIEDQVNLKTKLQVQWVELLQCSHQLDVMD